MKKHKAFGFDMDGVIADSEPFNILLEKKICQKHGIVIPNSEWKHFGGKRNLDIFTHIVEKFTDGSLDPKELVIEKRKMFLKHSGNELKFIPGAKEFVNFCRNKFEFLSLVTSSGRVIQEKVFDVLGLRGIFDVVITGDDISRGKPDPEPYVLAAERLRVLTSEFVIIEDSTNGVRSAKLAGCKVVGITTSTKANCLKKAGAHIIVKNFDEAIPIINTM